MARGAKNAPEAPRDVNAMRLDKFLKVSRIIKRRSVANDAAGAGHITINGKEAKPASDVRVGDVIAVRFGERLTKYEVISLSEHALKADAAGMYRIVP